MVSKTITFNYRYGIDIYFAKEVMQKAREFESKIVIEYGGKKIKNKSEDIRLHAVELRGLGKKNKEIAEILEVHEKVVSK